MRAPAACDDGAGAALYAGGLIDTAGGVPGDHIARWDGSDWSPLGSGMSDSVLAPTVFADGGGPALYAGGTFASALDSPDPCLAKRGCPSLPPASGLETSASALPPPNAGVVRR